VPERVIISASVEFLDVIVTFPVALAALEGAKVTDKFPLWPGESTVPAGIPLALNPAPEMLTFATVTSMGLVFATLTARVLLLPVFTFPKEIMPGVAVKPAPVAFKASPVAPTQPKSTHGNVTTNRAAINLDDFCLARAVITLSVC
jgi:hypothetical protein